MKRLKMFEQAESARIEKVANKRRSYEIVGDNFTEDTANEIKNFPDKIILGNGFSIMYIDKIGDREVNRFSVEDNKSNFARMLAFDEVVQYINNRYYNKDDEFDEEELELLSQQIDDFYKGHK